MRILIIEDEPRAANQLTNALKACDFEYRLLKIIDTVEDSVLYFQEHTAPDLIFMDIQLADGLSFEIFQQVNVEAPIIFTTAFDQYAIQAFKVNSIDYLLKPIRKNDLNSALQKFGKSNVPATIAPAILQELLGSLQAKQTRDGILVKEGSGFIQIQISELLYCYSENSITFGITLNRRFIIEETMDELFETLNKNNFYRINRGQMVAKAAILKIVPYFNHRVKLKMANPRDLEFIVSRSKTADFKAWLNN